MDLARISGMKVEELKNFLRLRELRTYEEVDLSPQNSFQSPECAVHRSGAFWTTEMKLKEGVIGIRLIMYFRGINKRTEATYVQICS